MLLCNITVRSFTFELITQQNFLQEEFGSKSENEAQQDFSTGYFQTVILTFLRGKDESFPCQALTCFTSYYGMSKNASFDFKYAVCWAQLLQCQF